MLKTEAVGRGFQHLPRDLANVNAWETMFDPYISLTSTWMGDPAFLQWCRDRVDSGTDLNAYISSHKKIQVAFIHSLLPLPFKEHNITVEGSRSVIPQFDVQLDFRKC